MLTAKHLAVLLLAILTLALPQNSQAKGPVFHARCIGVADGDTITVLNRDQLRLRIRLAWIDAPEKGQSFGRVAKRTMSELVYGKEVELHVHDTDRYGRFVSLVFAEKADVGLQMIERGLAWPSEHFLGKAPPDIQKSYREAGRLAQESRVGLWSEPLPVAPWEFRRLRRVKAEEAREEAN
jgi:endonuclease YncB( thermonuclease family)